MRQHGECTTTHDERAARAPYDLREVAGASGGRRYALRPAGRDARLDRAHGCSRPPPVHAPLSCRRRYVDRAEWLWRPCTASVLSISPLTRITTPSKMSEVIPSVSHSPTWSSSCGNPTVRLHTKPAIVTAASTPAAPQTTRRTRAEPSSSHQISAGMSHSDKAMLQQKRKAM